MSKQCFNTIALDKQKLFENSIERDSKCLVLNQGISRLLLIDMLTYISEFQIIFQFQRF